jgi:hypothetical protein
MKSLRSGLFAILGIAASLFAFPPAASASAAPSRTTVLHGKAIQRGYSADIVFFTESGYIDEGKPGMSNVAFFGAAEPAAFDVAADECFAIPAPRAVFRSAPKLTAVTTWHASTSWNQRKARKAYRQRLANS